MTVRVGVVVFPGRNCDRDTRPRASSWPAPSRSTCGTSRRRSRASPRSSCPGGFAYGDYLRAGVIARFSPVMRAVAAFAARRRAGPGHLQRLPGPRRGRPRARARCCATAACGSSAARSRSRPSGSTRRSPTRSVARRPLRHAHRPRRGLLLRRRRDARRAGARRPGPVPLCRRRRARPPAEDDRPTRTARCGRSPGSLNARRQRRRPDAPPGARRRRRSWAPTTGCGIIRSLVESAAERGRARGRSRVGAVAATAMTVAERPPSRRPSRSTGGWA